MKTVIIWDCCGETPLTFVVIDGDLSRFNRVYMNTYDGDKDLLDELNNLIYDENGDYRINHIEDFPSEAVKDGAIVIVAGFIP